MIPKLSGPILASILILGVLAVGLSFDDAEAKKTKSAPTPCFIVASVTDKIGKIDSKLDKISSKTLTNQKTADKIASLTKTMTKQNANLDAIVLDPEKEFPELEGELLTLIADVNALIEKADNLNPTGDPAIGAELSNLKIQGNEMIATSENLISQIS